MTLPDAEVEANRRLVALRDAAAAWTSWAGRDMALKAAWQIARISHGSPDEDVRRTAGEVRRCAAAVAGVDIGGAESGDHWPEWEQELGFFVALDADSASDEELVFAARELCEADALGLYLGALHDDALDEIIREITDRLRSPDESTNSLLLADSLRALSAGGAQSQRSGETDDRP